jgi:hypothetical protein
MIFGKWDERAAARQESKPGVVIAQPVPAAPVPNGHSDVKKTAPVE